MAGIFINQHISLPDNELEWTAIRAQGAGGQNVNKVASAMQLRFDINASSLPGEVKDRLKRQPDRRISAEGVIVIKMQQSRSQLQNRQRAVELLQEMIRRTLIIRPPRKKTRPTAGAVARRVDRKKLRGKVKALRGRIGSARVD